MPTQSPKRQRLRAAIPTKPRNSNPPVPAGGFIPHTSEAEYIEAEEMLEFGDAIGVEIPPEATANNRAWRDDHPVDTSRHAEAIELLVYVLDHGTPDQVQWITGALETSTRYIRLRKGIKLYQAGLEEKWGTKQ
ncbi:MAG TPA: hypothetical protein VNY05_37555 [Candidatus Acidoferrales bacterium]|jgi:hypothetical protein|nr:hypothetical protein [Candidatus Acidoferrales bacterium]